MADVSKFRFPTDIRFGPGARSALAEFSLVHGVSQPLLVTDSGMVQTEAFSLIGEQMDRVWPDGHATFTGVHPNPAQQDVEDAWAAFRDGGCDGLVGVGGGSALDVARAVRIKSAFPDVPLMEAPLSELPDKLPPFCAIPTTAGTGSEVGTSSVITIPALGRKAVLGGPELMADMAILDPQLTVGLPPHLTAATGMDAMTHAIESFVCPIFHPMCDAIALEAVRYVRLYLPRAYTDGTDIEARGMMQMAAAMGAVAFQKDLGAAHSLSHALSSEFGVQHGLANAIALPAVVRFNGIEDSAQYKRVAIALALTPTDDPAGQVADFLAQLNRSVGITQRLRDLDVPQEDLAPLAAKAFQDPCHLTNPRRCTEADMLKLYKEIW